MHKVLDRPAAVAIPDRCPICTSPYLTFVKSLPRKVGGYVDLFYCMECESACSPNSPEGKPGDDTAWHLSVHDRNIGWGRELFSTIGGRGPVVDVGCGIGSLLCAAREMGLSGVGFDTNPYAAPKGRDLFQLDLRSEFWSRDTTPDAGIFTCIMVLEHIHQPRALLKDLVQATVERDAVLFVSVPFFDRGEWRHLRTDNLETPGHFFGVPHAHVSHFSSKAMERLLTEFGARSFERHVVARSWPGYLVR